MRETVDVKTTLRTMLLAAAGVLCQVGVASAQAPAQPAGVSDGATSSAGTAAAPGAPATGTLTFGTGSSAPAADAAITEPAKPKERDVASRFRLSTFTWNQTATTTALGVGRDNIGSEDEEYSWEFAFAPRYYFVDTPRHQVNVNARFALQTEMTNSNITTTRREPLFQDIALGLGYSLTAFKSDSGNTVYAPGLSGSLLFPTSKMSQGQGRYLGTALTLSQTLQLPILGPKAKGLNSLTLAAGLTWSHLFARSYTPTNEDLNYPRQSASGTTFLSDQLSSRSLAQNRLRLTGSWFVPIYDQLVFANAWGISQNYKHDFQDGGGTGCDVVIANKPCVNAQRDPTRVTRTVDTSFDVSLSYDFFDSMLRADVGYQNATNQLGEDGQYRNILYSPGAAFYMDVIILFDGIIRKADSPEKNKAALNAAYQRTQL